MSQPIKKKSMDALSYRGLLLFLILLALLLAFRLGSLYFADSERFPITKIKISASYQHVTHQELEEILEKPVGLSFFSLPLGALQKKLNALDWVDTASVERIWPDTLKIKLVEKKPVALWGDALMTGEGKLFQQGPTPVDLHVPRLKGPPSSQLEVLQVYEKLSKILSSYGLKARGLSLSENRSWVLFLGKRSKIYLGKKELETRLQRFCKAYPAVFAEKAEQLVSVDLRYPRGMAVQWKQQTGR